MVLVSRREFPETLSRRSDIFSVFPRQRLLSYLINSVTSIQPECRILQIFTRALSITLITWLDSTWSGALRNKSLRVSSIARIMRHGIRGPQLPRLFGKLRVNYHHTGKFSNWGNFPAESPRPQNDAFRCN